MCWVRYQVDPVGLNGAAGVFSALASFQNPNPPVFAPDFGTRKLERELEATKTRKEELPDLWGRCIKNAIFVKTLVEDEPERTRLANVGASRRSHRLITHGYH